jgi:teichuronic acid biosynthesis glycosyltransferase TuaC
MRIVFLCKCRYMAKDAIVDRYARLYEIPRQLANLGHQVLGLCLSYYGGEEGGWSHQADSGELRWVSRARRAPYAQFGKQMWSLVPVRPWHNTCARPIGHGAP